MVKESVTEKDMKILRILKTNAKTTIRQISKKTGIRPSTVHQRLTNLIKKGVIERFTITIDELQLGYNFTLYMLVSGTLDKYLDKEILKNKNVVEVSGITGEYDLLLKLKFKTMADFNQFVIGFRERYSGKIHKTVTMVQSVSLKQDGLFI